MNTSPRLIIILLSLAAAGCAVFAYREHSRLIASQSSLASLEKELAALKSRFPQPGKGPIPQPAPLALGSSLPEIMQPAKSGSTGPRPLPTNRSEAGFGGGPMGNMMSSPDVQKLMGLQQRAALDNRYAGLFRQLKLSPANLEKFKNLLIEKQTTAIDAMSVARQQGITVADSREALQQVIANAQAEVDNSIRATLGDTGFAKFQSYEHTAAERGLVAQLQQRLSYTSTPLSDDQANQVVALLSAGSTHASQSSGTPTGIGPAMAGSGMIPGAFGNGNISITDSVIAGSKAILSADQIAALVQFQQEQQAQAQLSAQIRASRQLQPQTGSGPVPLPARP